MGQSRASSAYVSMLPRRPTEEDKFKSSGRVRAVQTPVKFKRGNCDHESTLCPTKKCIEGWEESYLVFLERTIAGRLVLMYLAQEVKK